MSSFERLLDIVEQLRYILISFFLISTVISMRIKWSLCLAKKKIELENELGLVFVL